jgi:cytochrome c
MLAAVSAAMAQMPTYQLGRTPTHEEVKAWDIAIGPEGRELPPGRGTAKEGEKIFVQRCAQCHGVDLKGGPMAPMLVGGRGTLDSAKPIKTVGSYWAYATTVYDYINRTMPWNKGGSLSPSELYAVTAYILFKNEIVEENDVLDAQSLPKVRMPNRDGFVPPEPAWNPRKAVGQNR